MDAGRLLTFCSWNQTQKNKQTPRKNDAPEKMEQKEESRRGVGGWGAKPHTHAKKKEYTYHIARTQTQQKRLPLHTAGPSFLPQKMPVFSISTPSSTNTDDVLSKYKTTGRRRCCRCGQARSQTKQLVLLPFGRQLAFIVQERNHRLPVFANIQLRLTATPGLPSHLALHPLAHGVYTKMGETDGFGLKTNARFRRVAGLQESRSTLPVQSAESRYLVSNFFRGGKNLDQKRGS